MPALTWNLQNGIVERGDPNNYQREEEYWVTFSKDDTLAGIDTSIDIYGDPRCPIYFDPHPENGNLFLVSRHAEQDKELPNLWRLKLVWSNNWEASGVGGQGSAGSGFNWQWIENPLKRPADIDWDTYQTKELFEYGYDDHDRLDVPVRTAAGEPLVLEEQCSRRVIRIVKNVQRVDKIFAKESDFINKDTVTIGSETFNPMTLWLTDIKVSRLRVENRIPYYQMSFALYYRKETWIREIKSVGFHEAIPSFHFVKRNPRDPRPPVVTPIRVYRRIKLDNGEYPATPVPIITKKLLERGILQQMAQNAGAPQAEIDKYIQVGRAVRTYLSSSKKWIILSPEEEGFAGLPDAVWSNLKLDFRTRLKINFTGKIPLK